jgi:hypothetical protein
MHNGGAYDDGMTEIDVGLIYSNGLRPFQKLRRLNCPNKFSPIRNR